MKLFEIIRANRVLSKIYESNIEYPINIAYKIYTLIKQLDDIEKYAYERISIVIPNFDSEEELSDEEVTVYNAIMNSDFDNLRIDLTIEELTNNSAVLLTISETKDIISFLTQKEV